MHADCSGFLRIEIRFHRPLFNTIDTPLNLTFDCYFEKKHQQKSSTYNEPLTPTGKYLMILFIFNINKVTGKMIPYDTPISRSYRSDKHEPTGTRKYLSFENILIKSGGRTWIHTTSYISRIMPHIQIDAAVWQIQHLEHSAIAKCCTWIFVKSLKMHRFRITFYDWVLIGSCWLKQLCSSFII